MDEHGGAGGGVTRAAAWNLVVPCSAATEAAARSAIAQVVAAHPARVLFLVAEDGVGELSASVTALCHRLGSARRQVCCEMITLRASGQETRHLADAARALLAPDLPVAVWWADAVEAPTRPPSPGGDSGQGELPALIGPPLASLADRWIVDTGAGNRVAIGGGWRATLAGTAELSRTLRGAVSDLAWLRLLPWRELTAQFFDPRAFRERLPRLDRLDAWIAPGSAPRAEAFLWLGWVASRLGWQAEGRSNGASLLLQRPNGKATAAVRQDPAPDFPSHGGGPAIPPGELYAVRLASSAPETSFTIQRDPESGCATLAVSTEGACPLPRVVRLPHQEPAQLLAALLGEPRRDQFYPEALSVAARLVQQGGE
jgi:glucose-6-phosphate dehydrogenase assembly protein OpcA